MAVASSRLWFDLCELGRSTRRPLDSRDMLKNGGAEKYLTPRIYGCKDVL